MVKDKDGDTVATVRNGISGTPGTSACSFHTVQWKMDILFAYRHGLQFVHHISPYTLVLK